MIIQLFGALPLLDLIKPSSARPIENVFRLGLYQLVQHFQCLFAITHNRNGHGDILSNGGGIDINVNNFGFLSKGIYFTGYPIIETNAYGNH